MSRFLLTVAAVGCTVLATSGSAYAAPMSYTSAAAFAADAAGGSLLTEDFETTPDSGTLTPDSGSLPIITSSKGIAISLTVPDPPGFPGTFGFLHEPSIAIEAGSSMSKGLNWTNPVASFFPGAFPAPPEILSTTVTFDFTSTAFPGGINAFGISLFNPFVSTALDTFLELTTAGGAMITVGLGPFTPATPAAAAFFGVIDDMATFTSVSLTSVFGMPTAAVPESIDFDDLVFGSVPPPGGGGPGTPVVPEPTSMALFGLTALGLAFGARRRKRKTQLVENTSAA